MEPAAAPAPAQGDASKQEEEEECGWCKWMKAGGCKEQFEVWMKCVDAVRDAGREDVETCSSVMAPLWDCMQVHSEYYSPQVDALKEKQSGQEGSGKPQDGEGSAPASPPPTISSAALDVDNITEADIERLLEDLDKEDASSK